MCVQIVYCLHIDNILFIHLFTRIFNLSLHKPPPPPWCFSVTPVIWLYVYIVKTCSAAGSRWTRIVARGRKPVYPVSPPGWIPVPGSVLQHAPHHQYYLSVHTARTLTFFSHLRSFLHHPQPWIQIINIMFCL